MPAPVPGTRDPRELITEDALFVHPSLLGRPLARPWRRGAAMAVDGLLVAMLTQATGVLFGFTAAFVLLRASARPSPAGGYLRRSLRLGLRVAGAIALFAATVSTWGSARERFEAGLAGFGGEEPAEQVASDGADPEDAETGVDAGRAAAALVALRFADTPDEARTRGNEAITRLRAAGVETTDIRDALSQVAESTPDKPWLSAVADSLLASSAPLPAVADPDSLALAYAAAREGGDSVKAQEIRPLLGSALAADSLEALNGALGELRRDRAGLRTRVAELERELENDGVLALLGRLAEDLGLGLGWIGLYFTATLALWRGQTPGKRLFGIRVIRLDAKPIGWWVAFERFGGYWAGIATGLLGFIQIFWDRNRQAIHDKITETVVVRET